MNITLFHQKSDTCRELFRFEISEYSIRYVSYSISYRDDLNDIWGDMWQEAHEEELNLAWDKINRMLDDDGYNEWDYEILKLKEELQNKYWPTCCKTIRGETRCSGQSGGNMPKYPWDEMGLKMLLIKEMRKIIAEIKLI